MTIDTAQLQALYYAALKAGDVLPAFPLAPLADYADRFFHDAIIDGWEGNKAALFQSAGSEFDMTLTDDAGNIRDDAVKTYYQLTHANPALVIPPQRVPNNMIEWRTAMLIFPAYGASDELHVVTLPLLAVEDMLAQNRRDAVWHLAQNPALQADMRDDGKKEHKKPSDPLRHPDVERVDLAQAAVAAYERVSGRFVPPRPQSALYYGADMERHLDDMAQFGRNAGDCMRPVYDIDLKPDPVAQNHALFMRTRLSPQN